MLKSRFAAFVFLVSSLALSVSVPASDCRLCAQLTRLGADFSKVADSKRAPRASKARHDQEVKETAALNRGADLVIKILEDKNLDDEMLESVAMYLAVTAERDGLHLVMDSVLGSSTPSGTDPSTISLISNDAASGLSTTTTFTVDQVTKRVTLYENGVYLGPITKESVSVIGFKINHITNSNSKAIRIELSLLSDQATPAVISKNFYDTVVLRGTYR